ncbi:FTSJ3, partial [Symbiodinium pilosum]
MTVNVASFLQCKLCGHGTASGNHPLSGLPAVDAGLDAEALAALAEGPDGPDEKLAEEAEVEGGSVSSRKRKRQVEDEDEELAERLPALQDKADETALVPMDEEAVRGEHRAFRWFSQDIFSGLSTSSQTRGAVREADSEGDSDSEGGQMRELSDAQLPKLPLTDKEKRKIKRRKDAERLEKLGIKPKASKAEEEKGSLEVAPLEPPKSPLASAAR